MKLVAVFFAVMILCSGVLSVAAQAQNDMGTRAPERTTLGSLTPSGESDIENADGTWTFTQTINSASTPPHYLGPFYTPASWCDSYAGFDYYSWFDQDYGWQHNYPHWAAGYVILSATLTIRAWDVDSEPTWGYEGEYDGIHVDGTLLDPGYLQGLNGVWSVTEFNLPISSLVDDGLINIFMDIDMHHWDCNWATTLNYSEMVIVYSKCVDPNPPYAPELSLSPSSGCVRDDADLMVTVTGPTPADPDGDAVTYSYRWFVDVGTGGFIDDEFAGRGDHTGNVVPAADTQVGDIWRVQVTPISGACGSIGDYSTATFGIISPTCIECDQPILSLLGYRTVSWVPPLWTVQVEVRNAGPGLAKNVNVVMNEDIGWLTVPDPNCSYGDIAEGATSFGADSYTFDLTMSPGGSFNAWFDVMYEDECGNQYRVRLDPEFDPTKTKQAAPAMAFKLAQNYPNPFNPNTTIGYQVPVRSMVNLSIFDVSGRLIRTLVNDYNEAGLYAAQWNGKDSQGVSVASGVYFSKLQAGSYTETKRMVLLR